jgi:N-acetylmuramoyl-L-alanine amidase
MSHQALRTRRGRFGVLAATGAALLLAACAAPVQQAEPPSTSFSPTVSAASSGNPITVPGLSTPSSESPTPSPSPEPETPTPEPTPEPESSVVDAPDDDYTPPPEQPQPQEPVQTRDPATAQQPATGGGKIVVIDPGHNGANGANPDIINALVDAGFGQTKPCNTTGTSTNAGYTEHEFNWGVATKVQSILAARGYDVRMTRNSDDGVGPCVNKRAAFGNDANAAAVVSIHGDGDDPSARGFYVMTAARAPAGAGMAAQSEALASGMRDALVNAGLSPSNHLGSGGLWKRDDLAGLNLSQRPTVMIEMGNMRNSSDAGLMSSSAGQQQMAQGIADGVVAYLG